MNHARRTVRRVGGSLAGLLIAAMICSTAPTAARAQWDEGVSVRAPEEAFGHLATSPLLTTQAEPWPQETNLAANPLSSQPAKLSTETSPLNQMLTPEELTPTLRTVLLVGLLSLVPAALVMTTCFARFAIVLGLLRQGLGAQQWLPNQIVLALSLFLTLLVMAPVWTASYEQGLRPYAEETCETPAEQQAALKGAFVAAAAPVREFMSTQIAATGNEAAIDMLLSYQQQSSGGESPPPQYYEDVPLSVLLPAYLLSELKTAFVIGFQIVLPFLVIDLVVASVLTGMGLMMLPPVLVGLPFKLLLFVLIDGWTLSVEMLLQSVPVG